MKKQISVWDLLRLFLAGWLLAVAVEWMFLFPAKLSGLDSTVQTQPWRLVLVGFAGCLVLGFFPKWQRWVFPTAFGLSGILALVSSFSWPFLGLCLLVEVILLIYALKGWNSRPLPHYPARRAKPSWGWITAFLALAFFLVISLWTLGRYYGFCSPTYDFGIFSQMFSYMLKTGQPLTTLERDGLLSHFAVHVSPGWYLLLPFYALWPRPETLQILQAAVMASAVIPLWLLGKQLGFSGPGRTLLCALLLLQPAFGGGAGYDIHENCLLTPLLLWLFWSAGRKNTALTLLFSLLTLGVKEDAAVYMAVFGVYLLLDGRKTGLWLLILALAWFGAVTGYLNRFGEGVMTYRYDNLSADGSLLGVVTGAIRNPLKVLYECADPEKLSYLLLTLGPLLGLPLFTRRYPRFALLIPWLLVNLMPDYQYQHDLFFQYSFGSQAFLLYLTALNLRELRCRLPVLLLAATVSLGCFTATVLPQAAAYTRQSIHYRAYYDSIRETLDSIPQDAAVTASTFYTAYLSDREILYDLGYASRDHLLESEYIVVSHSDSAKRYGGQENLTSLLYGSGYTPWITLDGVLTVWILGIP